MSGRYTRAEALSEDTNKKRNNERIGGDMTSSLVTDTVRDACKKEKVADGLTLRSDQGSPYTSQAYFDLNRKHHSQPSMSGPGYPYDNAATENFSGR